MNKMNYQKVIDTNASGLKINAVNKKSTKDHNGNAIDYQQVTFTQEHDGFRGKPMYLGPPTKQPRGIKVENNKGVGFTIFDHTDPAVASFISEKSRTQTKGWVSESDVKITTKTGKTFAKAAADGNLKEAPDSDSEDTKEYSKGDLMEVEDEKETDDGETWYLVACGGQSGFFETMNIKIAELLASDKRAGFSNEKPADILRKIKNPVYWPIDPETGNIVQGKNPSAYLKISYFAPNPKEGKKERYARYQVPGLDTNLDLETMKKSALTLQSSVLLLVNVYLGAGKIIPQYYITDAVVVDISEIKMPNVLQQEMDAISADEALVAKLKKQLAESKKFEAPAPRNEEAAAAPAPDSNAAEVEEDGDETTFDDLISNEPRKSKAVENIEPTMEEDIEIPGLPDV